MWLETWAAKWRISQQAINDLLFELGYHGLHVPASVGISETAIQARLRLTAAQQGCRLWRNNVGAGTLAESGSFIRFGLANDSAKVNEHIKSADLIGIRPILIGPQHVGHIVGQFLSREVKRGDWKPGASAKDRKREEAQMRWAALVNQLGGDAKFSQGEL